MTLDRRSFLQLAAAVPVWWSARGAGAIVPRGDDRTLLVLELVGGNDGLNTVIPRENARYAALRPKLSAVRDGAHALADGTALHPALRALHGLVGAGRATIVHGVGYPAPDRSHFRSRDIWHVGDPAHRRVQAATTGWLGRAADVLASARGEGRAGVPAAALGGLEVPLLLKAHRASVPSLRRIEDFQWLSPTRREPITAGSPARTLVANADSDAGTGTGGDANTNVVPRASAGGGTVATADDLRRFVAATATRAVSLADELARALASYRPKAEYPDTALARDLQLAAQLVVAGFGTRLLHVGFPGFDTHARQLPAHAGLLAQLDAALAALLADLAAHGAGDRVAVLVHSEFGRRAAENASQGTDHGAAAPVFVLHGAGAGASAARGGVLGPVPDLDRLDDGDPVATTDFRSVYRDLLDWLRIDARAVLGGEHAPAGLWRVTAR